MPAVPLSQVAVHLRPEDNVAVAARPIPPGAELRHDGTTLTTSGRIGLRESGGNPAADAR
jgi:altronate hydrolase